MMGILRDGDREGRLLRTSGKSTVAKQVTAHAELLTLRFFWLREDFSYGDGESPLPHLLRERAELRARTRTHLKAVLPPGSSA